MLPSIRPGRLQCCLTSLPCRLAAPPRRIVRAAYERNKARGYCNCERVLLVQVMSLWRHAPSSDSITPQCEQRETAALHVDAEAEVPNFLPRVWW